MHTPKAKRMKLEGPVFTTPIKFSEENDQVSSPADSYRRRKPLSPRDGNRGSIDNDENQITENTGGDLGERDSPCTTAEYNSLKHELHERNAQRDNLLFKIRDLTDNNRKYKDHLENHEGSKRQQVHILQKTHSIQLTDRDHLITSLQAVIQDHEQKIQQLEQRIHGTTLHAESSSPRDVTPASAAEVDATSSGASGVTRLVSIIKQLQDEKLELVSQLAEAQRQQEVCRGEHIRKIATLQKSLAEKTSTSYQRSAADVDQLELMAGDPGRGNCSTDTEKQLEKSQAENERLAAEISSLHRFYARNPTLSFSLQAEQLRRLEDENEQLHNWLTAAETELQLKETVSKEQESDLQATLSQAKVEKQQAERQLSHLQNRMASLKDMQSSWHERESNLQSEKPQMLQDHEAKWAALKVRDPNVIAKIVQIEIESDDLKAHVGVLEKEVVATKSHCEDRDKLVSDLQQQIDILNRKLEKGDEEKTLLKDCLLEEVEKERARKERAVVIMEKEMSKLQTANQRIRLKLADLLASFREVKQAYEVLSQQARCMPELIRIALQDNQKKTLEAVKRVAEENKGLVSRYHKEMQLRKKYHNELVELKGNIRVFCRVRPTIKEDGTGSQTDIVVTYDPDDDGLIYVSHKGRIQTFEFDRVFSETSTQAEVFEEVRALVSCCIDGFNVCIFAYGQTGSGKTFTMEGPMTDPGINQRALQELFSETTSRGQDWYFTIQVSVLEIYNEIIRDLLSTDSDNKKDVKMKAEGGGYHVPGLVTVTVASLQDVNKVFAEGRRNRATATTNMNEHSSRSHCLCCVSVTGLNRTTNTRTFGRLNLVDLAGSERVSKSGADGTRLKEAQNINKSLSCLGDVIHALRIKQNHIPFRNSKLTYLLQDSLGGDSKTLMIVQVAPVERNVSESTCSLSFGQRVRTVELGCASRKIEIGEFEKSPSISGSPPVKRKALSPKTSVSQSQSRFTPNKSSPLTRVTQSTVQK